MWSFNSASNQFVVSPEPDVNTMTIDVARHRCLILGTDGLWNMIPPQRAVEVVQHIDRQNKTHAAPDQPLVRNNLKTVIKIILTFLKIAMDKSI